MDATKVIIEPGHMWTAGILWPIGCTFVVVGRFVSRRSNSRIGWDDYLTIPALLGLCGQSAAVLYGVATRTLGYRYSSFDAGYLTFQSHEYTVIRKIFWASSIVQTAALTFVKLSCLVFYLRVFRNGINRISQALLYTFIILTAVWGVAFTLALLFFCGSPSHGAAWGPVGDIEKCPTDFRDLLRALTISDVVMDAFLVVFPLPYIFRLQMSHARKFAVAIVFILGSASIAMSAVRLETIRQFAAESKALANGAKPTIQPGTLQNLAIYFTLLELGFGLCAICLPALCSGLRIPALGILFKNLSNVFAQSDGGFSKESSSQKTSHDAARVSKEKTVGNTYIAGMHGPGQFSTTCERV